MGHHVICVDNNREKIRTLQSGSIPIYEPKLEDLIRKNVAVGFEYHSVGRPFIEEA